MRLLLKRFREHCLQYSLFFSVLCYVFFHPFPTSSMIKQRSRFKIILNGFGLTLELLHN